MTNQNPNNPRDQKDRPDQNDQDKRQGQQQQEQRGGTTDPNRQRQQGSGQRDNPQQGDNN